MPDSLDGVLTLLRNVGPGPLLGAAGVLILLRVATPEALRGAIGRLYGDLCPLVRDYWKARIEARRAEADRDRTIASHWQRALLAPHGGSPAPVVPRAAGGGAGSDPAGAVGSAAPPVASSEAGVDICTRRDCPFRVGGGGAGDGGGDEP